MDPRRFQNIYSVNTVAHKTIANAFQQSLLTGSLVVANIWAPGSRETAELIMADVSEAKTKDYLK